ncbi:tetratricopeptide repeat protein 36 isoform 1 [Tropilaelaps mercedesae]|uniref:Tetratricopeptide repeat protein 36 isoform 1 n=1 Tax=Tropilaelaps mercedesae TaxID=418985 RepID=A0A1V9XZ72_9ACAR|nr:tetratricopeptide repeat protein 36 isoform 1 [Tropilaelaps mercedesae]
MSCPNDQAVLEALFNPLLVEVPIEIDSEDAEEDTWKPSAEEVRAVALAEAGQHEEALQLLGKLLNRSSSNHEKASLLNDRAQVQRLLGNLSGAAKDLDAALVLGVNRKAQRQALAQKALLERLSGRREVAQALLQRSAALGSIFARSQLEAEPTNPYAKLCNQMVQKMFAELGADYRS